MNSANPPDPADGVAQLLGSRSRRLRRSWLLRQQIRSCRRFCRDLQECLARPLREPDRFDSRQCRLSRSPAAARRPQHRSHCLGVATSLSVRSRYDRRDHNRSSPRPVLAFDRPGAAVVRRYPAAGAQPEGGWICRSRGNPYHRPRQQPVLCPVPQSTRIRRAGNTLPSERPPRRELAG